MSNARRLALGTLFVLCALAAGVLPAAAQTIGGYVLVAQQRLGPITFLTYRATLSNAGGPALLGATATVTSSVRATLVLDGQLTFGPVAAGGSALSQDTIRLMHVGRPPFSLAALRWTVTTRPAAVTRSLRIQSIPSVRSGDAFAVMVEALSGGSIDATFTGDITISAAAAGGSEFSGGNKVVTAVAGVATFSGLVLNNAADGYTSSASASGATAAVSNSFNVTARQLSVAPIADVAAGTAFNTAIQARDGDNNVAENFTGAVTLSAAAIGGSNFNGGSPAGTAAAGVANFSGLALNNAASNYIATAASLGLIDGSSNAFDVGPHHLIFTAEPPASVRAGDAFAVTIEARDANDNLAENFSSTVTLGAAAMGGSNFVGGSPTANASIGAATFTGLVLNNAADGYTSSASVPGATAATSNSFNVTARTLNVQPVANQVAGVAFDVTVQALDADGSVAENFAGTVGLSASAEDGADFASSPSGPASAGVASFSGLILQTAATGYSITAVAPGVADGTSNLFDVLAAPDATAVLEVDGAGYAPFRDLFSGNFFPAHADYTLTNTGTGPMSWSAEVSDPWLMVSPAAGTLDPGANVVVQLSIDAAVANTLIAAEYTGRVYFSNRSGGTGSTTRPVYLALNGIWPLRVRPAFSFLATGSVQTPPAPATLTYSLTNLNTVIPLDWSGASNQGWVQLSSSGGTIQGVQSVDVTATLSPGPNGFPLGTSAATLTFAQLGCCPGTDILNTRFVRVIITEDDPPTLTVDAPVPDVLSTTLSGTVADNGSIAAMVWSNARTGQTGTINVNQGVWTVTIPLMVGTNDVTVTAFDDLGNFSSRTLSIDATSSPVTEPIDPTSIDAMTVATIGGGIPIGWSARLNDTLTELIVTPNPLLPALTLITAVIAASGGMGGLF